MKEIPKHSTVLDTGAEQLGRTYAQALLGAADSAGVTDQVLAELSELVDEHIPSNPRLAAALASPRVDESEKGRVIDRIFAGSCHPILIRFMKVMAKRSRLGYLRAVRDSALILRDISDNRVIANVRTAVALDDPLRTQIIGRLTSVTGKEVRLMEVVDPNLIGGMVIRIGDSVYDTSVSNRLSKMSKRAREGFSREFLSRFETFMENSN